MQEKKQKKTLGRHDLQGAREPAGGYAIPAESFHNSRTRIAVVAAPDPYDGRQRIRAVARLDLLDNERRHGLLAEGAFQAGREAERLFERGARVGCGGQWREGDRVDAATAHELAIVRGTESAIKVNAYLAWLVRTLGRRDARILSRVLGDRLNFAQCAIAEGKDGTRGAWYVANRFRHALEDLAEAKAAKGKGYYERRSVPRDQRGSD